MKYLGKFSHKLIGNAIFIRTNKITILNSKRSFLKDNAKSYLSVCQSDNFFLDIKSKYHSIVLVHCQLQSSNQSFVVANTHLYWNPFRPDIKTFQAAAALDAIFQFASEAANNTKSSLLPPIIFCGDFNTMPTCFDEKSQGGIPSALFQLLEEGMVDSSHPQHPDTWFTCLGSNYNNPKLGKFLCNSPTVSRLTHPHCHFIDIHLLSQAETLDSLKFQNIFSDPSFVSEKPLFTTKTDEFQGWIDHIFVNPRVNIDMVLTPPLRIQDAADEAKVAAFTPIPNQHFASDHIPVGFIASMK